MSVCVSISPICATNKELTTCLLVLLNQQRDNASELAMSLSAYESSLFYLEQNFHSYMISMVSQYYSCCKGIKFVPPFYIQGVC